MSDRPPSVADRAASLRADQIARWRRGERPSVEDYLVLRPDLADDADALLDLIYTEVVVREELGEKPGVEEYVRRFPRHADALRRQFELHGLLGASVLGDDVPTEANAGSPLPAGAPTLPNDQFTPRPDPFATMPLSADGPVSPAAVPRRIGHYEILGELGRGGMGVVYKARQPELNRLVALKMIHADGRDSVERFLTEARAAARLQHPNIVQIYEVGEADGRPFVALEYVAGGSLAAKVNGTPLPPTEAVEMLLPLADAMQHAHSRGVIHRDLKPANVLLEVRSAKCEVRSEPAGSDVGKDSVSSDFALRTSHFAPPKIADFGLAKCLDAEHGQTRSGVIMGTPSYMPPEQAEGRQQAVGPTADVYALGAILYEMLTGRPPFKAASLTATIRQVISEEPVAPGRLQSGTPTDLETICLKCLQKEPGKRYASAGELADDLRRYRNGEPIRARRTPLWERTWKWARRRPADAALVLLSVLGVALLVAVWASFTASLHQETERAQKGEELARIEADNARRQERIATGLQQDLEKEVVKVRIQEKLAEDKAQEARRQRDHVIKLADDTARSVKGLANYLVESRTAKAENPSGVLLRMACNYVDIAVQVRKNEAGLEPELAAQLARAYEDGAIELLRGAAKGDLFERPDNRAAFKADLNGRLAPLRGRPEFEELVKRCPP
jgi:serine/threonine protein kinase